MPYIDRLHRASIDPAIDALVEQIKRVVSEQTDTGLYAGLLNYSCTRIALGVIPARRYASIAMVAGVFQNVASEFYRRFAAPYEDEKITQNGDVYPTPSEGA